MSTPPQKSAIPCSVDVEAPYPGCVATDRAERQRAPGSVDAPGVGLDADREDAVVVLAVLPRLHGGVEVVDEGVGG